MSAGPAGAAELSPPMPRGGALLSMSHISKSFGRTAALADASIEVLAGEVHGLVGENGAGKSTLMQVLSGALKPDAGQMRLAGRPFSPRQPRDALRAGIAMVYQELNLAPHLSVQANLLLGRERTMAGALCSELWGGADRRACRQALKRLGLTLDLDARVGRLGVADQQLVEIARALLSAPRLMIMDEPTSALARHEAERLFAVIRQLRGQGISIVYISHFLEEVEQVCDRVTVLRDGRVAGGGPMADWPRRRMIEAMVGRQVEQMYPRLEHAIGGPVLEVRGLRGAPLPRSAGFTLHRGEVLGIAGLVGAGRTEMLRALFGLDPSRGGEAVLRGVRIRRFDPADWSGRGVCMLSEDRKAEGLAQGLSCVANITLPAVGKASWLGWLRMGRERREADRLAGQLGIRWGGPEQKVNALSGGNQQKVALARLLYCDADVLLLDEPTRGIDVGAKVDLYRAIGRLAQRGKAVVMVSSYLPELMGVCDRIAVMSRGVLAAPRPVSELTPQQVMAMAVAPPA